MSENFTNIILLGETGNGKSTLGNEILGYNAFKVGNDIGSGTQITIGKKGKGDNANFFVIDTPGLPDSNELDKEQMIQLVEYVKEHKELNAIIIVLNYQQVRFPYNIQTMLKLFCNIFKTEDIGSHIAFIFTNSFTKRGKLTQEQKFSKFEKIFPAFKKLIEEETGKRVSNSIPIGFVDIDPEEGIDEVGKMDLERILTWAYVANSLKIDKLQRSEPKIEKETQEYIEKREDGEYIITTVIKKERDVYYQLDGSIIYGEWKEKEKKEEKFIKSNNNNNEINNLKNELSKANKVIEQQKLTINELQNKLNNCITIINNLNNDINNYKKIIVQKDLELNNNFKSQLNNNIHNNNINFNDIMCVNFISSDQSVHYAAPCLKTNTFAEIEEKLYKQYPKYRETNNNFIANGTQVLRFKTIDENKIGNGLPVTLIVPS